MKRLVVFFRPEATRDITEIFQYILQRTDSLDVARRYTDRIFERCLAIGDAPLGGRARPDLSENLRSLNFRRMVVIYYRVVSQKVQIVRVLHKGRDGQVVNFRVRP